MDVVLIDIANDPLTKLYGAYRTCYTPKTPREVWDDIAAGSVSREKIAQFVEDRLKTGHVSPLEQVVFWFGISGVSRSLSHQFVRHRIGISFEQQSQRYVRFTGKTEKRMGYCDEDLKADEACPLSNSRPHKLQVIEVFKRVRAESGKPMRDLDESDFKAAEEFREAKG